MWVFNSQGFFSAVENRNDHSTVIVRARSEDDMLRLGERLGLETTHTPTADYPYRLTVSKADWSNYLAQQALEIDYPNFKDAMAESFDAARMHQLHEVWAVMAGFQ